MAALQSAFTNQTQLELINQVESLVRLATGENTPDLSSNI